MKYKKNIIALSLLVGVFSSNTFAFDLNVFENGKTTSAADLNENFNNFNDEFIGNFDNTIKQSQEVIVGETLLDKDGSTLVIEECIETFNIPSTSNEKGYTTIMAHFLVGGDNCDKLMYSTSDSMNYQSINLLDVKNDKNLVVKQYPDDTYKILSGYKDSNLIISDVNPYSVRIKSISEEQ